MTRPRLVILDDYQQVAPASADWSTVHQRYEIEVVPSTSTAWQRWHGCRAQRSSSLSMAMRERTPFPRALLEPLPDLRLLVTTGARNASIDGAAANRPRDHGVRHRRIRQRPCAAGIGGPDARNAATVHPPLRTTRDASSQPNSTPAR